jgi:hypothetical protein
MAIATLAGGAFGECRLLAAQLRSDDVLEARAPTETFGGRREIRSLQRLFSRLKSAPVFDRCASGNVADVASPSRIVLKDEVDLMDCDLRRSDLAEPLLGQ